MRDLLNTFYAIQISEEILIEDRVAFKSGNNIYFITLATNNKAIHMEQSFLAHYLVKKGYAHTAHPVPNHYGEWITNYRDENYLVLKVIQLQENIPSEHGKILAQFHQKNRAYAYEPQHISSYGQWKNLWIDKLTSFEKKIIEEAENHKNNYYRLLMDVLPYIIGISENAIQYVQETNYENRYDQTDQGTITFQRYDDHLQRPIIWHTDLVYDHIARDLAEFIRHQLIQDGEQAFNDISIFLKSYQLIHPLSIFSWRLLYARLIYPVHLFDLIEEGFVEKNFEKHFQQLQQITEKQTDYEHCLDYFFQRIGLDQDQMQIPVLNWF